MNEKAAHVLSQGQWRDHECHWPGCPRQVPPARWGCKEHWFMLPKNLRDKIWAAYRPGQENTRDPSPAYIAATREAQAWIAANHGTMDAPGQGALDLAPPAATPANTDDARKAIEANLKDGFMEVVGVDDKGERILRVTDKGRALIAMSARWKRTESHGR